MRYLAIDQGGTKTCALVCDATGCILGIGYGKGACWSASGMEEALGSCTQALHESGFEWKDMDALCAAMTGADWPEDYEILHQNLKKATALHEIFVMNDCEAAYYGGSDHPNGVCICAGTGTNVFWTSTQAGSGCLGYCVRIPHLGKLAMEAAIDGAMGIGEKTALTELLLTFMETSDIEELIRGLTKGSISARKVKYMTGLVTQAAIHDSVARNVCRNFSKRCADYACMLLKTKKLPEDNTDVVVSGGIFKESTGILFQDFSSFVSDQAPKARLINAEFEPVVGAMKRLLPMPHREHLLREAREKGLLRL